MNILNSRKISGFSLIELIISFVVIGILALTLIPTATDIIENAHISATEKELKAIQMAIMGDPDTGLLGFRDNIGSLPANLPDLYQQGAYPGFNSYTQTGWNGPYLEQTDHDSNGTIDILEDSWKNMYVYNSGAGTITSCGVNQVAGGGDDIVALVQ